jgi:hypothetical protein
MGDYRVPYSTSKQVPVSKKERNMMIFFPDAVLVLLTTANLGITGRAVVSAQALV